MSLTILSGVCALQVGNAQHGGLISGPQLLCHIRRHCHGISLGLIYARLDMLAAGHAVSDRDNATVRKNCAHIVWSVEVKVKITNYYQLIGQ